MLRDEHQKNSVGLDDHTQMNIRIKIKTSLNTFLSTSTQVEHFFFVDLGTPM